MGTDRNQHVWITDKLYIWAEKKQQDFTYNGNLDLTNMADPCNYYMDLSIKSERGIYQLKRDMFETQKKHHS